MLDPFPLQLTILTPQDRAPRRGRHATSSQYAKALTIRLPEAAWDAVYKATRIVSQRMSEAEFMRQSIQYVAAALIEHNKKYEAQVAEQQRLLDEERAKHERSRSR